MRFNEKVEILNDNQGTTRVPAQNDHNNSPAQTTFRSRHAHAHSPSFAYTPLIASRNSRNSISILFTIPHRQTPIPIPISISVIVHPATWTTGSACGGLHMYACRSARVQRMQMRMRMRLLSYNRVASVNNR